MICQEVMELMHRYIDGDLDQQETSLMMDHVGQCPDCAAMLVRLQRLSSDLEQLPRVVPKYSLVDAILPELERIHTADLPGGSQKDREDSNGMPATRRSRRPSRHLFGELSGVVAAGVVAGLLLFGNPGQWSFTGGKSSNDAAAPSELSGPAASASNKVELRMSPLQKSADALGTDQASELKPQVTDQSDAVTDFTFSESSASPQHNEAASPDVSDKTMLTPASGAQKSAKPSAENPEMTSPSNPPMSLKATNAGAAVSVSKDGKWRALATEGSGTLQVYNTADESELFHSEVRKGTITLLDWNEDSTILYYTFTDIDGLQKQLQFSVLDLKETER
jgi:hypothetical protein